MTHILKNSLSPFVLSHLFNKKILEDDSIIYWRDCILQSDMVQGEQGYI